MQERRTRQAAFEKLEQLIAEYNNESQDPEKRLLISERDVIDHFIKPFLQDVLGWPHSLDIFVQEQRTVGGGIPDITMRLENQNAIYVEAKRFGIIKELAISITSTQKAIRPETMTTSGMATDRTREEQQAINYAFNSNAHWAILTNFERFRLFNARRDTLVFAIESVAGYKSDFDWLWENLSYDSIIAGSLERLENVQHRPDVDTAYLNFINEYRQLLAEDIWRNRDKNREWLFDADGNVQTQLLRSVVQRLLDRLVLIRYAEDHFVMPAETLHKLYDIVRQNPYAIPLTQQLRGVFRSFDERHNSMLFAEDAVDAAIFTNDHIPKYGTQSVLGKLVENLYIARYRSFTADILGNTYEQYLGKQIDVVNQEVVVRDNLETRKKQGSYYTPQVIVQYIVDHSLGRYLYGTANGRPEGAPLPGESPKTSLDIAQLRILDNACGSGSFLIYAYEVLATFYRDEIKRLQAERDRIQKERAAESNRSKRQAENFNAQLFDNRIYEINDELLRLQNYPFIILQSHVYGVDLDPQAAEIAAVNLIMRALGRKEHLLINGQYPLPLILGQNIKVGNALVGMKPDDERLQDYAPQLARLCDLRRRLVESDHRKPEHHQIHVELQELTAALSDELNTRMGLDEHFSDLERVTPFHWAVEFPEVFVGEDGTPHPHGGFTIIIGNPPWEIVKPDMREYFSQFDPDIESKLSRANAERRIETMIAASPRLGEEWAQKRADILEDAAYYQASPSFSRQGRGDTATHKLFLERNFGILRDGGRLGYLIPSGIYTDLGTKHLREMLLNDGNLERLVSITNGVAGGGAYFEGIHRSFKIAALVGQKGGETDVFPAAFYIDPRTTPHPNAFIDFFADEQNYIPIQRDSIARFSPDSLSIMEFQSRRDYDIADKIYADWPLIGDTVEGGGNIQFAREFDMTNDRQLFNTRKVGLPLYEGKMIHQYDAFYGEPQYWLDEVPAAERLTRKESDGWYKGYRFAFREVARSTDNRTVIASVLPPQTFSGHTLWIGNPHDSHKLLYCVGIINSYCFDWLARFQVGTHVTLFVMKSLPMPRLEAGDPYFDAIVERAAKLVCVREEFADLWVEVMGTAWSPSVGASDPAERQALRDEIDALVAQLYGLTSAEFEHILGTFPLVFPATPEGDAKKSALLETFAAMGANYQ